MTSIETIAKKVQSEGRHAFFLDIDGTMIVALAENGVSPRLAKAISDGQKKGHMFFVNTGRAYGYIPPSLLASADFDGVVSGLGGYKTHRGKVIHSSFLTEKTVRSLCEYCEEHGESVIFECEERDEHGGRVTIGDSGFFNARRDFAKKEDVYDAIKDMHPIKITVPYVPCEEYAAFLEKEFDMSYIKPIYAEGAYIGNNKGTAIYKTCDLLGIPYENTVAVGDSDNDVKMLSCAAISVAMGNAPEHLKAMTTLVCDRVENDGAAKLIETLVGLEKK